MEDDKGPAIKAACLTLWTLGTVFVCLRLFTRKHIRKNVQVDDYLIILATVSVWMGERCDGHRSGCTRKRTHTNTLTLEQQGNAKFYTILSFPFGVLSFTIPKLAVATLLTRLLNPSRVHHACLWGLAWLCLISVSICIIILFTQCTPAAFMWGGAPEGKCISPWVLIDFSIYTGAISAFTDLCLAIYPAVILWGLQINIRKKTALSVALGIGSISCGVAIYKSTRLDSLASPDFIYDTADLVIWTAAEATSTVIACCIPILQPLVEMLFGRRILSGSSSSSKNYDYHNDRCGRHGGMELSKIGRSGIQHTVTSHPIGTRSGDPDLDSQESILPKDGKGTDGQNPKMHSRHIKRTDVITVTYGDRATIDTEQKEQSATTAM
ncbi:unnamed protein product [Clonostachys byssicola]|uniref:Rhodopsin domain-containing protein n=1 Tax=Clonostachys byssicola TaxID=160290 RepID=A0A9N9UDV9_9HYPO|nr:unnamed protein product [Clonostachys byssicola]